MIVHISLITQNIARHVPYNTYVYKFKSHSKQSAIIIKLQLANVAFMLLSRLLNNQNKISKIAQQQILFLVIFLKAVQSEKIFQYLKLLREAVEWISAYLQFQADGKTFNWNILAYNAYLIYLNCNNDWGERIIKQILRFVNSIYLLDQV